MNSEHSKPMFHDSASVTMPALLLISFVGLLQTINFLLKSSGY